MQRSHLSDLKQAIKNNVKDSAQTAANMTQRSLREMRGNAEDYLWGPFMNMQEQMARIMDNNMRAFSSMANLWQGGMLAEKMLPKVRVWEDDKEFHLETKLPNNNPDNMEITMHNGFMTLKWEDAEFSNGRDKHRRSSTHVSDASGHYSASTTSLRTVMIPDNADPGKAHAICKNGILEVIVPKKALAGNNGRSIPIEKTVTKH
ncbi:MAG TPA: Hsp20/alpha crystallin family protein [Alphaproteobacteria bacterium]|nr:Hsp20/alpha crystallin family protein [Alphaproteobacteria bacterium]